jgi:hypothetical protein
VHRGGCVRAAHAAATVEVGLRASHRFPVGLKSAPPADIIPPIRLGDEVGMMLNMRTWGSSALIVVGCAVGCGNGDDSSPNDASEVPDPVEACSDDFTPCGGRIVGLWEVREFCAPEPVQQPIASCPQSSLTITQFEVAGTVEFRSDESFETTGTMSTALFMQVPISCMSGSCAELEADLNPGEAGTTVCTTAVGNCDCTMQTGGPFLASPPLNQYIAIGSSLSILAPDGPGVDYEYCVTGDTLVFRLVDGSQAITLTRSGT